MNNGRGSGKKRKADLASHASIEAEKNLYPIFATAATAVTNLYAGAVQSQRAAHTAGSRAALERVLRWVCEHHGGSGAVPTAHLVEMLHEELQAIQGEAPAFAGKQAQQASGFPPAEGLSQIQHPGSDCDDEVMGLAEQQQQQLSSGGQRRGVQYKQR